MFNTENNKDSPSLKNNLEEILRTQHFFLKYTIKLINESLKGFDEIKKQAQQDIVKDVGKHGLDFVDQIEDCMYIEELGDISKKDILNNEKKQFQEILDTDQRENGTETQRVRILAQSLPILFNDMKKPILLNMGTIYIFSILETYIKQALTKIYESKPEILMNTQKTLNYEEIIKNRNSILHKIIDLSIEDLGYKSFKEINTFFNKNTFKNMDLSKEFDDWELLIKYDEWRNLIVHNNSEFGEKYIKKFNLSEEEQLKKAIFFPGDFNKMFKTVRKFMIHLHFKLVNMFCNE